MALYIIKKLLFDRGDNLDNLNSEIVLPAGKKLERYIHRVAEREKCEKMVVITRTSHKYVGP